MISRFKKQPKSYEDYEKIIEKHLNDDFDVHEYLNQNNLTGGNMDDYSRLYNSMLVTKNQKRKKYDSLKVNYNQMVYQKADAWTEALLLDMLEEKNAHFSETYQEIAKKITFESQVEQAIHKEIVEVKKSINLLKGDIGHFVDRNQSAKLLESKICKVKIVADDQLKRVSLAYLKDKDEVRIRSDMQKSFNKKIKNATIHEESTLKRLKKTYLDTMVKKKEIHDRLNHIQKINSSIHASGDKQKKINGKRRRILSMFKYFNKLSNLFEQVKNAEQKSTENSKFINWFKTYAETRIFTHGEEEQESELYGDGIRQNSRFFSSYPASSTRFPSIHTANQSIYATSETELIDFEYEIIRQFNRITEEIDARTNEYNLTVKRLEEITCLSDNYQHEIQKLQLSLCQQASLQYIITPEMKEDYMRKMKNFTSILKTIFAFLEYVEKKINYSNLSQNSPNPKKYSETCSQFFVYRHSLSHLNKTAASAYGTFNLKVIPSQQDLKTPPGQMVAETKHYASELYRIHCALIEQEESQENESIFEELTLEIQDYLRADIKTWMFNLKDALKYGKLDKLRPPKFESHLTKLLKLRKESRRKKDTRNSGTISQKIARQSEQKDAQDCAEQNNFHNESYLRYHNKHHSLDEFSSKSHMLPLKSRYLNMPRSIGRNLLGNQKNLVNLSKLNNQTEAEQSLQEAQRIKLLQNVDMDYYKMLKSTLKMEKENTRKNYQFLKNFKRTKYSSNDSILEQKRFQISFSVLFAGKKAEATEKRNQETQKSPKLLNSNRNTNRRSIMSNIASVQKSFMKVPEASKRAVLSNTDIRLPDLTATPSEESMKEMKDSLKRLKAANSIHSIHKRSRFSGEVKEVLNLVA